MDKWDVVRVYCDFLPNPHDKYCICISPDNNWFMFINSEPPRFRKARGFAVEVSSFEAIFLNHTSYIDTTKLVKLDSTTVEGAIVDQDRLLGKIHRNVRQRIITEVSNHNTLPDLQREAIIE